MARRPTGIAASVTCLVLALILALSISSLQATRLVPETPPVNTVAHQAHMLRCPHFLPPGLFGRMCKKSPPHHQKPSSPTTEYPPPVEHNHDHDQDHDQDHNDHNDVPDLATPPADASGTGKPAPPKSGN